MDRTLGERHCHGQAGVGGGVGPARQPRRGSGGVPGAQGVLYLAPEARFETLLNLPEAENIGARVNAAMREIEKHNPQLAGVLPVIALRCDHCGMDLGPETVCGTATVHQVTEIEFRPVVRQYEMQARRCPGCSKVTRARRPQGTEGAFGPNVGSAHGRSGVLPGRPEAQYRSSEEVARRFR